MDNTLLKGYNPNTTFIGYSPNDFFYSTAIELGTMPSDDTCNNLSPYNTVWDVSCNNVYFARDKNDEKCIKVELCKNKDYANKLLEINRGNASSDEKYYDIKDQYDTLFMDSINLGIGCVFLLWFIFKNR
jgi:hypothetical protein